MTLRRLMWLVGAVVLACIVDSAHLITPERALSYFGASVQLVTILGILFMVLVVGCSGGERSSTLSPAGFASLEGDDPTRHCPVCGASGGGPWVRCLQCETPHHSDCARYVGRCSVYGCGQPVPADAPGVCASASVHAAKAAVAGPR